MRHTYPQAARLLEYLSQRPASTLEVRRVLDVAQPSGVALRLNKRWAAAGDPRRIRCEGSGSHARWFLEHDAAA